MTMGISGLSAISSQKYATPELKAENEKNYKDVYAHEMKHKQAGGALAGGIVIEKDGNGMVTGGHVNIAVPGLNKKDPKQTITQAQQVIDSAMAPDDPSAQDYKVANQARAVLAMAQEETKKQTGNKLDISA